MRSYKAEYNQRNNDIKSSTIDGRMVSGNMKLYSANVNMSSKHKDNDLVNNRPMTKNMPPPPPSTSSIGRMSGSQTLNQNINMERNTPDLTNALKSNPFVIPYTAR